MSDLSLRSHKYFHQPFGVFSVIASPEALFRDIEAGRVGGPVLMVQDDFALSDIEIHF